MGTVKGVNRTVMDTEPRVKLTPGFVDGRVKTFQDTYEALTLAINDVIEMGPDLPVGARILEVILHSDDLTNTAKLSVGDTISPARYISATDHGSAEKVTKLNAIGGRNYAITSTTQQITITNTNGIATGTIKLTVFYTHD